MRPGQGVFSGRLEELDNLLSERKLMVPMDSEVELIIKPSALPEGFEEIPIYRKIPEISESLEPADNGRLPPDTTQKLEKNPSWFSRKIKSILRDNAAQRHSGNKRDGDLDMKHLYKALTTGRCFTDKDVISNKRYSVALVIDCSGSMAERSILAGKCASQFILEFQKLTALSVILFNAETLVYKLPHKILKDKELIELQEEIFLRSNSSSIGAYGNHDAFAISKAVEVLRKEKGKKIIVVMSDGEPACDPSKCKRNHREKECYQRGSPKDETRDSIHKAIVRNHSILGLGIQNDSVASLYPDYKVISNLPEMYPSLVELLQRAVKRGGV